MMFPRTVRYFIGISTFLFLQCERDDICLEGTPGTPRMIVVFKDNQNRALNKVASGLVVVGTATSTSLAIAAEDSILIPLNPRTESSVFEFYKTQSATQTLATSLEFRYNRYDLYINRACGYKAQYILQNPVISATTTGTWIETFEVIQDTIKDETQTHIYLYH
ncbi:MAG: DUF6452 family protein [Flavobacteriaceae bacterium]